MIIIRPGLVQTSITHIVRKIHPEGSQIRLVYICLPDLYSYQKVLYVILDEAVKIQLKIQMKEVLTYVCFHERF